MNIEKLDIKDYDILLQIINNTTFKGSDAEQIALLKAKLEMHKKQEE